MCTELESRADLKSGYIFRIRIWIFGKSRIRCEWYMMYIGCTKKHDRDGHAAGSGSESKIWRRSGFLIFGVGSGFGVNFSESAHLCSALHHHNWRLNVVDQENEDVLTNIVFFWDSNNKVFCRTWYSLQASDLLN